LATTAKRNERGIPLSTTVYERGIIVLLQRWTSRCEKTAAGRKRLLQQRPLLKDVAGRLGSNKLAAGSYVYARVGDSGHLDAEIQSAKGLRGSRHCTRITWTAAAKTSGRKGEVYVPARRGRLAVISDMRSKAALVEGSQDNYPYTRTDIHTSCIMSGINPLILNVADKTKMSQKWSSSINLIGN
jgi:hypothetical protein